MSRLARITSKFSRISRESSHSCPTITKTTAMSLTASNSNNQTLKIASGSFMTQSRLIDMTIPWSPVSKTARSWVSKWCNSKLKMQLKTEIRSLIPLTSSWCFCMPVWISSRQMSTIWMNCCKYVSLNLQKTTKMIDRLPITSTATAKGITDSEIFHFKKSKPSTNHSPIA